MSSVPKTMAGDRHEFVGAGPETVLLKSVQDAATAAPGGGLIV